MLKRNRKNNEEVITMEQTTFIKRHANKILVVGGLVVSAGTAYLLYKHNIDLKNKDKVIDGLAEVLKDTREDNKTLMEALSEGVFEEAIATVTRKINSRKDKQSYLLEALDKCPNDQSICEKLEELAFEITELIRRKEAFLEGQHLYEIKHLEN